MINWNEYFKKLNQQAHDCVNNDEVNAPVNYAPPIMQRRYKKLQKP